MKCTHPTSAHTCMSANGLISHGITLSATDAHDGVEDQSVAATRKAFLVVEALQGAHHAEGRTLNSLAGAEFATERRVKAESHRCAYLPKQRQVDAGRPKPSIGVSITNFDRKSSPAIEKANVPGCVGAWDDAVGIRGPRCRSGSAGGGDVVRAAEVRGLVTIGRHGRHHGTFRILDAPASSSSFFGSFLVYSVKDFFVAEVFEDVLREAEPALQAQPEAIARLDGPIVQRRRSIDSGVSCFVDSGETLMSRSRDTPYSKVVALAMFRFL